MVLVRISFKPSEIAVTTNPNNNHTGVIFDFLTYKKIGMTNKNLEGVSRSLRSPSNNNRLSETIRKYVRKEAIKNFSHLSHSTFSLFAMSPRIDIRSIDTTESQPLALKTTNNGIIASESLK